MDEKRYYINDDRILIYNVSEGYSKPTYTITEGFIENGELKKGYSFSQWDDYGLNGWTDECDKKDKLSFEFDISHPLYMALFHLLNYDNELIIDDDGTEEHNKRYLSIYKKDGKINIDFIDKTDDSMNKFNVFIKNITFDGRSKVDSCHKDTKERLIIFFNEVHQTLNRGSRQISIEEYLLDNSFNDNFNEMKRVFKRKEY